jgi:TonB family protein
VPKPAAADALTEALVSFLTEVRIRSGGVDAAENIVTTVNTAPIPSNVEHAFVKNIDFSIASGNLDQVVTTVSSSEIDLVGVVMTVRGAPVDELPLSALDFDRYVEPEAPGQGLRAGSGWVDVNFSVDARGRTADVTIADSNLPSRFNAPVLTSVKKWRFKPYERNGKAVSIRSSARLRFQP